MRTYHPHSSSIGNINANLMALFCYIAASVASLVPIIGSVSFLAPLVIYIFEKNSDLVRFHAAQALSLDFFVWLASLIIGLVTRTGDFTFSLLHLNLLGSLSLGLGGILHLVIEIAALVFSIIAMVRAYQYSEYEIPLIGALSRVFFRPLG